jgi:hypothetical protein
MRNLEIKLNKVTAILYLGFFLGILSLASCGKDDDDNAGIQTPATRVAERNAVADESRADFEKRTEKELSDLRARLSELQRRDSIQTNKEISALNAQRRAEVEKAIQDANQRYEAIKKSETDLVAQRLQVHESVEAARLRLDDLNNRQKFEDEVLDRVSKIDVRVQNLQNQAKRATGDMKAKLQNDWTNLKTKRDEIVQRFNEFRTSSNAKWQEVKANLDESFNSLESKYSDLFK